VPLSSKALDGRARAVVVDALAVQDDQQLSRLRVLAAVCSGRVSGGWLRTTRCRVAAAARPRWRVRRGGRVIGLCSAGAAAAPVPQAAVCGGLLRG
jgi:hypothetical protein